MPNLRWYQQTLVSAPGAGGLLALGMSPFLSRPIAVAINLLLIFSVIRLFIQWEKLGVRDFFRARRCRGAKLLLWSLYASLLAGDYLVGVIGLALSHHEIGVVAAGIPFILLGPVSVWYCYPRAKRLFDLVQIEGQK